MRNSHSKILSLRDPVHLAGLLAEHQAAHSYSLACTQRNTVDSARLKHSAKLSELRRLKGSMESRTEKETSGLAQRTLVSRVNTHIEGYRTSREFAYISRSESQGTPQCMQ